MGGARGGFVSRKWRNPERFSHPFVPDNQPTIREKGGNSYRQSGRKMRSTLASEKAFPAILRTNSKTRLRFSSGESSKPPSGKENHMDKTATALTVPRPYLYQQHVACRKSQSRLKSQKDQRRKTSISVAFCPRIRKSIIYLRRNNIMGVYICVLPPLLFVSFSSFSSEINPCLSDRLAFDLTSRKQTRIRPPSYSCLERPRIRRGHKSLRRREIMPSFTPQKLALKGIDFVA